jgi:hypothetical protein
MIDESFIDFDEPFIDLDVHFIDGRSIIHRPHGSRHRFRCFGSSASMKTVLILMNRSLTSSIRSSSPTMRFIESDDMSIDADDAFLNADEAFIDADEVFPSTR